MFAAHRFTASQKIALLAAVTVRAATITTTIKG
jgi:hypothetical protein